MSLPFLPRLLYSLRVERVSRVSVLLKRKVVCIRESTQGTFTLSLDPTCYLVLWTLELS